MNLDDVADLVNDAYAKAQTRDALTGTATASSIEDRNACTVLTWTCEEPDVWTYAGPKRSLERILAGEIPTYHEFVADDSPWCLKPLHPAWRERMIAMLEYTRIHDCNNEICQHIANRIRPDGTTE